GPSVGGRQVSGAGVSAGQKAIGPGTYGTLPVLPSANSKLQNLSPQVVPHDYPLAQNAWIMNRDGVAVGNTNRQKFEQMLNNSPIWEGPTATGSPGQKWVNTTDNTRIRIMEPNGRNPLRADYETTRADGSVHDMDPATWHQAQADPGLRGKAQRDSERAKAHLPLHDYE
uniref:hypothetical protein n=1 Tax=Rothia nasisuis TaxID=2109647 RepID=UPI001F275FCD